MLIIGVLLTCNINNYCAFSYIGSVLAMTSALPEDYAKVLHGIISNLNTKLSDINTGDVVKQYHSPSNALSSRLDKVNLL